MSMGPLVPMVSAGGKIIDDMLLNKHIIIIFLVFYEIYFSSVSDLGG